MVTELVPYLNPCVLVIWFTDDQVFSIMVAKLEPYLHPGSLKAEQSTGSEDTFPVFNEVRDLPFPFFACFGSQTAKFYSHDTKLTSYLHPCVHKTDQSIGPEDRQWEIDPELSYLGEGRWGGDRRRGQQGW